MASDRVIIVRISGIGFQADKAYPLTLTSRSLSYLQGTAIEGVVTELGSQMSSEIGIFSSMGSDPTTTFSVLANTQTLSVLMSRGATEIRGQEESSVQTTRYVTPSPTPTIHVTDSRTLNTEDIIRINGVAYRVLTSDNAVPGTLTCQMVYGSVPQPIPVRDVGYERTGCTLYASYWQGQEYPTGGAEQQAVTISTVEIDAVSAAAETVIFRGVISTVNIQTSSGTDNQIQVECMSLMGVIKNAPWAPSSAAVSVYVVPGNPYVSYVSAPLGEGYWTNVMKAHVNLGMTGPIFDDTGIAYDTRFEAMQVREGKSGGVAGILDIEDGNVVVVTAAPAIAELNEIQSNGFNLIFSDGYYSPFTERAYSLNLDFTEQSQAALDGMLEGATSAVTFEVAATTSSEIAFSASDFQSAIIDLIFGTFNTDATGASGVRAWGMSAWIPFPFADIADIIDLGSLNNAFNTEQMSIDIPLCRLFSRFNSEFIDNTFILPVQPDGPKTIGEVLDFIMKNLGLFMVYDKGRISFGRWASENGWATPVNDVDFAEPKIALTYDRQNSIQSVIVEYPNGVIVGKDAPIMQKYPIANVERIVTGAGKVLNVGSMMKQVQLYLGGIVQSFAFRNGTDLVLRYSQSAGIIQVTLRDSTKVLSIGEYVAFSSAFIPNGAGSMGVVNATGIVLKATRSWQTPTTSYTLFLPGYLFAANRISQVSVSGRVLEVADTATIVIEDNAFTSILSQLNAPKSDQEAFDQTLQRTQALPNNFFCALYDQYGTPYNITSRLIGVGGTALSFSGPEFDVAIPGDIIIMDFATTAFTQMPEGLLECWDAFQADGTGLVNGDANFSYPWSR